MKYYDSHCHLQDFEGVSNEIPQDIDFSKAPSLLCCATSAADSQQVIELSKQLPAHVYYSLGMHPWFLPQSAAEIEQQLKELLPLTRATNCLAIGETGLDYWGKRKHNKELQLFSLQKHLEAASELKMPVVLHCVKAWNDLYAMLQKFPRLPVILHGFSGNRQLVKQFSQMNSWFSFNAGTLSQPKVQEAFAYCSVEKILIETDAPYMPGPGLEFSHPRDLPNTAALMAELKGIPEKALLAQLWENAGAVFGSDFASQGVLG